VDRLIAPSACLHASSGIGTARLQLRCSPCLPDFYAALASPARTDFDLQLSPVFTSFQTTRAILLASATAANFAGLRLRSAASQARRFQPLSLSNHGGRPYYQHAMQFPAAGPLWTLQRSCFEPDVAVYYFDRGENRAPGAAIERLLTTEKRLENGHRFQEFLGIILVI